MIEPVVLVDKLNAMGSVQEIREFLGSQQVQGYIGCSSSCVIANWMRRESQQYIDISECVSIWDDDGNDKEQFELAEPVEEFILKFDDGQYPELVINITEYQ